MNWRVVSPVLAAIGLCLGLFAFRTYDAASAQPSPPSFDGTIAVATNACDDRVTVEVTEATAADDAAASTVNILVNIQPGFVEEPTGCLSDGRRAGVNTLLVAVGLTGDAKAAAPPADGALVVTGDHPGQLTVRGGLERPRFASATGWPPSPTVEWDDQVLFGAVSGDECFSDTCSVSVSVPMSRSMVESTGARWTLSTPRLGAEPTDADFPRSAFGGFSIADGLIAEGLDPEGDWYLPEAPRLTFSASPQQMSGSVQQSGTAPVEAFGSVWQDSAPFAVDAFFDRPQQVAKADAQQFWAGVLVSLGGSVVVWAAEIALNGRKEDRAAAEPRRP